VLKTRGFEGDSRQAGPVRPVYNADQPITALKGTGIRRCFEEQFSVERMARDYIELYDDVLRRSSIDAVVLSTRAAGQREAA
jgi:hypothetical protein